MEFTIFRLNLYTIDLLHTLNGEAIPEWLVLGRTILIMKNKDIGPYFVSNYRPITYMFVKYLEANYIYSCRRDFITS